MTTTSTTARPRSRRLVRYLAAGAVGLAALGSTSAAGAAPIPPTKAWTPPVVNSTVGADIEAAPAPATSVARVRNYVRSDGVGAVTGRVDSSVHSYLTASNLYPQPGAYVLVASDLPLTAGPNCTLVGSADVLCKFTEPTKELTWHIDGHGSGHIKY
ncbi:MAG: hypothetical protein M3Z03_06395 [Actinomycetota bacterium]|nr:hypothetical protein [Actinomycetota bacterium]